MKILQRLKCLFGNHEPILKEEKLFSIIACTYGCKHCSKVFSYWSVPNYPEYIYPYWVSNYLLNESNKAQSEEKL